nr:16S rRNA (uracil(1498)-N(3))-methyltransferase [Microlunatus panaciterrae]
MFLVDLADPLPPVGSRVEVGGEEGRHAAVVRRIRPGESVLLSDGAGRGVRGVVTASAKTGIELEVVEQLTASAAGRRFVAVQALAKGDRSELAVEMLTEMGIDEVVPWQASRSIVRWTAERSAKSLNRWRSTVREATKQSRRLRVPEVAEPASTADVVDRIGAAALALILHEDATVPLAEVALPESGTVLIVIGPEGGISAEELGPFTDAGAVPVTLGDGVLRTSTAGVAALAGLMLR